MVSEENTAKMFEMTFDFGRYRLEVQDTGFVLRENDGTFQGPIVYDLFEGNLIDHTKQITR